MRGMRSNADKLVAFSRGRDFLIGAGEVRENRQMLEKSCISTRFIFISILQNYKRGTLVSWNIV